MSQLLDPALLIEMYIDIIRCLLSPTKHGCNALFEWTGVPFQNAACAEVEMSGTP
jgi:hypothetical protein